MEVLLLLLEVKRTESGKLASNSKPVCDLASWCSNPAISIKHGFGVGFQLGPLAPLPGMQQLHPSPSQRGGLLAGQPRLGGGGHLSPLLTQFFSPSINHSNCRLGEKKKFKNLYLSVGMHQNWSCFFPPLLVGTQSPGGRESMGFSGLRMGNPHCCVSAGGATCQGCCRVTAHWVYSF